MERLVDRSLPYFSLALNVLLAWHLLQSGSGARAIVYGRKYASLILQSFDLSFL